MAHWGYTDKNGPATWHQSYEIANGSKQSPINIVTSEVEYDADLGLTPLNIDYSPEESVSLTNNGHSIMCKIHAKSELSGGPLKGKYRLEQFHLHWGSKDGHGSEHTVDGKSYSAELHLVHYNTKYGSFSEAVDKDDGLAVLGVMINPGFENQTFRTVTNEIHRLKNKGSDITLENEILNPTLLLPGNTSAYWTYPGSLTTPPLYESVCWIVFNEPIELSKDQLNSLRSLVDADGGKMQDNYRPPVPLHDRKVISST